jgi:hypothetical protein
MSTLKPQFSIGQKVNAIGFTNCFGKPVEPTYGLVVSEIRLVKSSVTTDPLKPYYRIKADASGMGYVEGAERFFEAAQ